MGIAKQFNGLLIHWLQDVQGVLLNQPVHVEKLVTTFGGVVDLTKPRKLPILAELKLCRTGTNKVPISPPLDVVKFHYRALLGGLNYLSCCTRPDITYVVNQLSRYSHAPTQAHWDVAVDCLRYVVHTKHWGIVLGTGNHMSKLVFSAHHPDSHKKAPKQDAVAYADANHGTGIDDKKSVSGMVQHVLGGPVSWNSKVQPTASTSTCESELRALSDASRESLWIAKLLKLFDLKDRPFLIKGDNNGAIQSIKKYSATKYTKHIEIHHEFMKDRYSAGDLDFEYIPGDQNPADIFTKALGWSKFQKFREALGMASSEDLT
jgi:hypothetical protein